MTKELFETPEINECFKKAGMDGFEQIWSMKLPFFEDPNYRRNGRSGVSKHTINDGNGCEMSIFIKRQQNHNYRAWTHPLKGLPTFYREYKTILRLRQRQINTLRPLYFGVRKSGPDHQAILITLALDGFYPLTQWEKFKGAKENSVIKQIAVELSKMHSYKIQHGGLYDKHIFARIDKDTGEAEAKLVDLEKSRYAFSRQKAALHDLDQLFRHSPAWRREHKQLLLEYYLECMPKPAFNRKEFTTHLENRITGKQQSREKKRNMVLT